jgi:hypothetical protein
MGIAWDAIGPIFVHQPAKDLLRVLHSDEFHAVFQETDMGAQESIPNLVFDKVGP